MISKVLPRKRCNCTLRKIRGQTSSGTVVRMQEIVQNTAVQDLQAKNLTGLPRRIRVSATNVENPATLPGNSHEKDSKKDAQEDTIRFVISTVYKAPKHQGVTCYPHEERGHPCKLPIKSLESDLSSCCNIPSALLSTEGRISA